MGKHLGARFRLLVRVVFVAIVTGLTLVVPAAPAHAAPSVADVTCSGPARLFQLRNGDVSTGFTELWYASLSSPASESGFTYYSWRRIYTFNSLPALAIAAHQQTATGVYLYVTDAGGGLREYKYDSASGDLVSPTTLYPSNGSGKYAFNRLTSDGERLYGVKGGDLYVMTGLDMWAEPNAMAYVKFVGYPSAFYGAGADGLLGYTDSSGYLRYLDVSSSGGWSATTTTVRTAGWSEKSMTSAGGGLLLRFQSQGMLWRHVVGDISAGTATEISLHQTLAIGTGTPDERITTAPLVCRPAADSGSPPPSSSAMVTKARQYVGQWGGEACEDAGSGTVNGQCKQFLNCISEMVHGVIPAPGYYGAYEAVGFALVSKGSAGAGDVVQLYKPGDTLTYYAGMHTAILTESFGGDDAASVVDSNYGGGEMVAEHVWNPYAQAGSHGLSVAIWRFSG